MSRVSNVVPRAKRQRTVTHAIVEFSVTRIWRWMIGEPHMVKYDDQERQKLDMHTDKSEWTF
jgi:hypothetical protein